MQIVAVANASSRQRLEYTRMLYLSPSGDNFSHHHLQQATPLNPLTGAEIHGGGLAHLQVTLIQPSQTQGRVSADTITRHTKDYLHPLNLPRRADPDEVLLLSRFPCRMPRELDRRVVIVQRREPVLVLAQEREDEPELVHHTRVRAQRRVPRDDQVSEAVCTRRPLGWSLGSHETGGRTDDAHGGEEFCAEAEPCVLRARPAPALLEAVLRARLVCDETRPRVLLLHVQEDALRATGHP